MLVVFFFFSFKKYVFGPKGRGEREIQTSDLCFIRRGPQPIVLPLGLLFMLVVLYNIERNIE